MNNYWTMMGWTLLSICAFGSIADATRIDSIAMVHGPGVGTYSNNGLFAFAEGFDDVNEFTVGNFWFYSIQFVQAAPVDVVFNVVNAGGSDVSEYAFDGSLSNNSGKLWNGFKLALGFGTYDPADYSLDYFAQSSDIDRLDFDRIEADDVGPGRTPPPRYSSFQAADADHMNNTLQWHDILIASPGNASVNLHLDIPNASTIPGATGSAYQFTLRFTPLVAVSAPEPASLGSLLICGAIMMGARRRRSAG